MQQIQQLSTERMQLQADNAKLKTQAEALQKQLDAANAARTAAETKVKRLEGGASKEATAQANAEQLERSRAQMQELIAKFRETAQTLRDSETDRNGLKGQIDSRDKEFAKCVDSNVGLYTLNTEVLDRLEHHGFWSSVSESEPFTRLARTRLENLIDDYRERALQMKMSANAKSADAR
jgi:chromosome segregation ATPase